LLISGEIYEGDQQFKDHSKDIYQIRRNAGFHRVVMLENAF
jgi:hypothetical protein